MAKYKEKQGVEAYRVYMSDTLSLLARGFMKEGTEYPRYYSLLHPDKNKQDNRTGDEIFLDVMNKAGLKFEE